MKMKTVYEIVPDQETVYVVCYPERIPRELIASMIGITVASRGKAMTTITLLNENMLRGIGGLEEKGYKEICDTGYTMKLILPMPNDRNDHDNDERESAAEVLLDILDKEKRTVIGRGEHFYLGNEKSLWVLSDKQDLRDPDRGSKQWLERKLIENENSVTLDKCQSTKELDLTMRTIEATINLDVDQIFQIATLIKKADEVHLIQVS